MTSFAPHHTAGWWWGLDLNPGAEASGSPLFPAVPRALQYSASLVGVGVAGEVPGG